MAERLRVLFIEDNSDDVALMVRVLSKSGYDCHFRRIDSIQSLRDALGSEPWDIVLSDHNLPGFGALEALAEVRRCRADLPFVVVSGAIGEELAVAAMRMGAQDYVMKSNLVRLGPVIDRELREARVRTERRAAREALRESQEKRNRQLEVLSRATQSLNLVLDGEAVSRALVLAGLELVQAEAGSWGVARDGVVLFHELIRRGDSGEVVDFQVSQAVTRLPYISNEPGPELSRNPRLQGQLDVRQVINVPVLGRAGTLLGCLELYNAAEGRDFDGEDLGMLQGLAGGAAIAFENARLYAEARDAIQARDEFLTLASHELKTPITSISIENQLVLRAARQGRLKELPEQRLLRVFENTQSQLGRLSELVEALFKVSEFQAVGAKLEPSWFNIDVLLRGLLERESKALERSGTEVDYQGDSGIEVFWDRQAIERVLTSLLSNAMKYGARRPISIRLGRDPRTRSDLADLVDPVRISFSDRGIGIARSDQERIFGRFERAVSSRNFPGFGLGLYLSKHVVEAHGGRIELRSQTGEGSTFSLVIPRSLSQARARAASA